MIGQTVSHYRLTERIGTGAFSTVYKAEDLNLPRTVAIKILTPTVSDPTTAFKRFIQEIEILSDIKHPNVVVVHERVEKGDVNFLVMEHIDGPSLRERMKEKLDLAEIVRIATEVGEGLRAAHDSGVIHRDVKPENIMIMKTGHCKVLDFGVAHLVDRTRITSDGRMIGTPHYMAPEQFRPDGVVDARTDIYALGVILYEMLTGKVPFDAKPLEALGVQILTMDPPRLSEVAEGIPDEVRAIVYKALEKDPADRYASMGEMLSDLSVVAHRLEGEHIGGVAAQEERERRERRRRLRRRAVTWSSVVASLAIAYLIWKAIPPTEVGTRIMVDALAVIDFSNRADPDDHSRSVGITGLVHTSIVESSPCRVVSPSLLQDIRRRLFGPVRGPIEEHEALQVAREAGATVFVSGEIFPRPDPYVRWDLVETENGGSLASGVIKGDELFALADEIVAGVLPVLFAHLGVEATAPPKSVGELTTTSSKAYQHYVAGILAAEEARDEDAIRELEHAVRFDSTFALALFELGRAHFSATSFGHESDIARAYAERAWEQRLHLGMKDRLRLEAYRQRLDWRVDDALDTYREMQTRWPDDHDALSDRIEILNYYWYFDEAVEVAGKALGIYPDDFDFGFTYGLGLSRVGRLEEALQAGREYVRQHPKQPNAWDELGTRFLNLGMPDSAETYFAKALEIKPDFLLSRLSLAYCDFARGNVSHAITRIEQCLAEGGLSPGIRVMVTASSTIAPCPGGVVEFYRCVDRLSGDSYRCRDRSETGRWRGRVLPYFNPYHGRPPARAVSADQHCAFLSGDAKGFPQWPDCGRGAFPEGQPSRRTSSPPSGYALPVCSPECLASAPS